MYKLMFFEFWEESDNGAVLDQTYETTYSGADWDDIWDDFANQYFISIEGKYGTIETGLAEFCSHEVDRENRVACMTEILETLKLFGVKCNNLVKTYDRN